MSSVADSNMEGTIICANCVEKDDCKYVKNPLGDKLKKCEVKMARMRKKRGRWYF